MNHSHSLTTSKLLTSFKLVSKRFAILHLRDEFIKFLLDCNYNVVKGTVSLAQTSLTESKLKKFKTVLTFLCNKKVKFSQKQKLTATNQGLKVIRRIYEPVQNHFKDEQAS